MKKMIIPLTILSICNTNADAMLRNLLKNASRVAATALKNPKTVKMVTGGALAGATGIAIVQNTSVVHADSNYYDCKVESLTLDEAHSGSRYNWKQMENEYHYQGFEGYQEKIDLLRELEKGNNITAEHHFMAKRTAELMESDVKFRRHVLEEVEAIKTQKRNVLVGGTVLTVLVLAAAYYYGYLPITIATEKKN